VRFPTEADKPGVYRLGLGFALSSQYSQDIVEEEVYKTLDGFLDEPQPSHRKLCLITEEDNKIVGMFLGFTSQMLMTRKLMATEFCWYVDPDYRKSPLKHSDRLRQGFDYWSKTLGCDKQQIACANSTIYDKLKRLYRIMGYKEVETAFIKDIR